MVKRLTVIISLLLLAGLVVTACKKGGKMDEGDILEAVGAKDNPQAKVKLNKYINLNRNQAMETLALVQYADGEVLYVLEFVDGNWKVAKDLKFFLPQYGPYQYLENVSDWVPGKPAGESKRLANIVSRVSVAQVQPQTYNSIFVAYLMTPIKGGPGIGSITEDVMILEAAKGTGYKKVFSLREGEKDAAKDEATFADFKKIKYRLLDDGSLIIKAKSGAGKMEALYMNNGLEFAAAPKGKPFIRLYETGLIKGDDGTYIFNFNGKNKGSGAAQSFVTVSGVGLEAVKVIEGSVSGAKFTEYAPGSQVHNFKSNTKVAADNPLVEFEKAPWGENYRIKFQLKLKPVPAAKAKLRGILMRFALKTGGEYVYQPLSTGGKSFAGVDQQGKPAYLFPLPK